MYGYHSSVYKAAFQGLMLEKTAILGALMALPILKGTKQQISNNLSVARQSGSTINPALLTPQAPQA